MAAQKNSTVLFALILSAGAFALGRFSVSSEDAPQAKAPASERSARFESDTTRQVRKTKAKAATGYDTEAAPGTDARYANPRVVSRSAAQKGVYSPMAHAPENAVHALPKDAEAVCENMIVELQEQLAAQEKRRQAKEGTPIKARDDVSPRFSQKGLVDTFSEGFSVTDIDGRVESVDCTEYPCILFGRLQGDEGAVAELEDSAPFAVYDNDIGVMLTWASGDHAHGGSPQAVGGRQKPPEVSLFSFAFYSESDRQEYGELIDRRIRVRTAEYWNASSPAE